MLETEAGAAVALELWTLAKAAARTPWEALHDPHLAYNLTVMRAAIELKRVCIERSGDAFGAVSQRIMALE